MPRATRAPKSVRTIDIISSSTPASKRRRGRLVMVASAVLAVFLFVIYLAAGHAVVQNGTSLLNYTITQTYPHDPDAFTQGLEYQRACNRTGCQDIFWESTGLYGRSTIREVDVLTGKVLRQQALARADFGEGLVRFGSRLFQLTWLSGKTYFYDVNNFANSTIQNTPLKDGWGATTDGRYLIVSDGSSNITWLDPHTLKAVKSVAVTDDGKPVPQLNELEFINNEIWANVWMTECIAKINPSTGAVTGWVSFIGLRQKLLSESLPQALPVDVLNGIAWDAARKRLFITGKCWSTMYEVKTQVATLQMTPSEHLQIQRQCGVTL